MLHAGSMQRHSAPSLGRPAGARAVACSAVAAPPPRTAVDIKRTKLGPFVVSEVCLGTMTFGEQTSEAEGQAQLSHAKEMGINFLDTAEIYPVLPKPETQGATSRIIGRWLKSQKRQDFVIATKVAGRSAISDWVPAGRTEPPGPRSMPRVDGPSIRAAVEGELRRLGTDHLDLLQIHWPDRYVPVFGAHQFNPEGIQQHNSTTGGPPSPFEEQVEAMGQLIKQGKIRAWGLSNETSFGVFSHCAAADKLGVPRPITVQNCYNLVQRTFESELAETCHQLGLGLLPWSALAGGSLTGKYLHGRMDEGSRFSLWGPRYARFNSPRVQEAVEEYVRIAKAAGLTPAQLGYAFCRSRWFIPSTIVGAQTLEQLKENLGAWSEAGKLSQETLAAIQQVHTRNRNPTLVD